MLKAAAQRIPLGGVLWLPIALVAAGAGCASDPSPLSGMGEAPAGALRGELDVNIATYDDGNTSTDYTLRTFDGREIALTFDSEPDVPGNAKLDVWGEQQGDKFRVRRFEVLHPAAIEQALQVGMPYKARNVALVIVNNGNVATPFDPKAADIRLNGIMPMNVPSVRQYYMEVSYGRQDIAGMVVGPLDFAMTGCNTGPMAQMLTPMIPGTYDHYLWYIQPRNMNCPWAGLASSGTPNRPSKNTWYNNSSGCVVLVQEPGHNFGMQHSSAMKCNGVPIVDDNLNAMGCTHQEYGDRFDPMGGGCRHMNAFQKAYQGWFDKCNLIDSPIEGTYTLLPLELPCDGVQAITVPFPHTRMFMRSGGGGSATNDALTNYVLEMRSSIGIDSGLAQPVPVVQIRAAGNLRDRAQRGLHTWILDMNPATPAFDGLTAGQSFTDPAGSPKITVVSIDNTKATVKIEYPMGPIAGAGTTVTCLDDTTFTGPGPGPESCAPRPASAAGAPPAIPDGGPMPGTPPPRRDAGAPGGSDASAPSPDASTPTGAGGEGPGGGGTGGAGGAPGGGGPSGGGKAEAGASTGPVTVTSGCGCHLGGSEPQAGGSVIACMLGLAAVVLRRRRRR
jgi:hypothetical protein